MILQIAQSAIDALPFDFAAEVETHRQARETHAGTIGQPAPVAIHPLVDAAVVRVPPPDDPDDDDGPQPERFIAQYEVIDDRPAPPSAAELRAGLVGQVGRLAAEASERVAPMLKRRLVMIEASRAASVPEQDRTADQVAAIEAQQRLMAAVDAVEYHLAVLESQIHDLPDDQLQSWQPAPFPT